MTGKQIGMATSRKEGAAGGDTRSTAMVAILLLGTGLVVYRCVFSHTLCWLWWLSLCVLSLLVKT